MTESPNGRMTQNEAAAQLRYSSLALTQPKASEAYVESETTLPRAIRSKGVKFANDSPIR